METKSISSVNNAGIFKRIIASIVDFGIAVILFIILALGVFTPIANTAMNYGGVVKNGMQFQIASHLFIYVQENDAGEAEYIEVKDYTEKLDEKKNSTVIFLTKANKTNWEFYYDHLQYYYCNYLTNKDVEVPNPTPTKIYDPTVDNFVAPNWNVKQKFTVGGLEKELLPSEYYTPEWFRSQEFFGKHFNYDSELDQVSLKDSQKEADAVTELKNQIVTANKHMYYSDYFSKINSEVNNIQLFIILTPFFVTMLLVYFLTSMIFKDGETLGKKLLGICLISKNGYSVKKRQVIFRFIVFLAEMSVSLFIVGVGLTSIATFGAGMLICLVVMLANKNKRAPHDFAAYTLIIDKKTSVWFKSAIEENRYLEKENEKELQSKEDNKTIVDSTNVSE